MRFSIADCNDRDLIYPFVTLGVITNCGGLFAVTFTGKLEHSVAGIVIAQAQSGVAFYWQSDTLITDYSFNTGCFLWTLCLRNGKMLMWSVPFFTRRDFRSLYDTAVIDVRFDAVYNFVLPLKGSNPPNRSPYQIFYFRFAPCCFCNLRMSLYFSLCQVRSLPP